MPALIERGHVYIAQPPLYKIKKGKQEQYLKDDAELQEYLLQSVIDGIRFFVSADSPPVADVAFEQAVRDYFLADRIKSRLANRYDPRILDELSNLPPFSPAWDPTGPDALAWAARLQTGLQVELPPGTDYRAQPITGGPENRTGILVSKKIHGLSQDTVFSPEFFASSDYSRLVQIGEKLRDLFVSGAFLEKGERRIPAASLQDTMKWLTTEAKKGQHIQRYKGLGEMNPDQLWETTMDRDARRLLKVRIEDAVAADEIFTTLMGDQVEPRREFIEDNALDVANLDV
jgi:DNA gyrase subunit B